MEDNDEIVHDDVIERSNERTITKRIGRTNDRIN